MGNQQIRDLLEQAMRDRYSLLTGAHQPTREQIDGDRSTIEAMRPYRAALASTPKPVEPGAEGTCTLGVGDGGGKLFVHGDYESIKACQAIIFDKERLQVALDAAKAEAEGLRAGLQKMVDSPAIWSPVQYAYHARQLLDAALLRAEKPEPAVNPSESIVNPSQLSTPNLEGRTCESEESKDARLATKQMLGAGCHDECGKLPEEDD